MKGFIQLINVPFFVPTLGTFINPTGVKVFGSTWKITGLLDFLETIIVVDFSSTFEIEISCVLVAVCYVPASIAVVIPQRQNLSGVLLKPLRAWDIIIRLNLDKGQYLICYFYLLIHNPLNVNA